MFAAFPARILRSFIPRCAGKAQRGGWVGGAGGLLPLVDSPHICACLLPPPSGSAVVLSNRTGGGALDFFTSSRFALCSGAACLSAYPFCFMA